jgi:hypothetical protein
MSIPIRRALAPYLLAPLVALLAVGCSDHAPLLEPDVTHPLAAAGGPHVVHVAPPEGNPGADQASILAALQEVRPGGTVQFAPGRYVIGVRGEMSWIRVTVPRVTLQGHPDGTTLQGCDLGEDPNFLNGCVGLQLVGGRQTVRNLTFEYFNQPLIVGFNLFIEQPEHQIGGYRIENNTFRSAMWGVRMFGQWTQPAVVRNNNFVNMFLGVQVFGRTAHVTDNDFSAPDWSQIPTWFEPWGAILFFAWDALQTGSCAGNLAAGNRIEDHAGGIGIEVSSEEGCNHNVIRDNTIVNTVETEGFPAFPMWVENYMGDPALLAHTLIQGNRILGSQGMGMFLYFNSQTRVVNNTIEDVSLSQFAPWWLGDNNGTGVVVLDSRENHILNNRVSAVEGYAVSLTADHNHVATRSPSEVVRDLGVGNRITGPGSVVTTAAPVGASAGAVPTAAERVDAERRLRERLGARGLLLGREAAREAAPR